MVPIIVNLNQVYGLIAVSGEDALTFLQGQLTNDIRTIQGSYFTLSGECNLAGRLYAIYRIFIKEGIYYLQLPLELVKAAVSRLQKYGAFSNVVIEEVSEVWGLLGITGLKREALQPLLRDNQDQPNRKDNPKTQDNPIMQMNQIDLIGAQDHDGNPSRCEWIGPRGIIETLYQKLKDNYQTEIIRSEVNTWKLLDIEAGLPEIWLETSEAFLPHYVNLPELGGVSFTKGCYRGQEIVARMEYRAKLKRHMIHHTLPHPFHDSLPLAGSELEFEREGQKTLGRIVTAAFNREGGIEVLIEVELRA